MNMKLYVLMAAATLAAQEEQKRKTEQEKMNTPTPEQALGDCLSVIAPMIGKKQFTVTKYDDGTSALEGDNDYMVAVCMCLELVIKHGQHFAGLEAEVEEWKRREAFAVSDLQRELRERDSVIRNLREQAEAAEARVRESEGLLKKWVRTSIGRTPPEVAAFLAARGETK